MAISQVNSNGFGPTSWTTAGRPSSPFTGQMGFNTTLTAMEYYNGTTWQPFVGNYTYSASYLVVAGGGAGAGNGSAALLNSVSIQASQVGQSFLSGALQRIFDTA